jgi:hypothetical protein
MIFVTSCCVGFGLAVGLGGGGRFGCAGCAGRGGFDFVLDPTSVEKKHKKLLV